MAGTQRHVGSRSRAGGPALVVAVALALAGCTADPDEAPAPTPTETDGTEEPAPTPEVDLPDHPAGRAAGWVMDLLAQEVGTPVADAEEWLAAAFLEQVSAQELASVLDQLRPAGPWEVQEVRGDERALAARLQGVEAIELQLALDADDLVESLLFTAPAPEREAAADWESLVEEVAALPGDSSLLVARVEDGQCVPEAGTPAGSAAGASLPMGSMIKLYVLGAVVDAVEDGLLTWDDTLVVTDGLRSLPSGQLQDAPTGTEVPVDDAARAMIAISDNTATDMLIDVVGRERVEQALVDMGHAEPDANRPLATTRELFWLGWGGGRDLRTRWRDADEDGRRALLAEAPTGVLEVDVEELASTTVWRDGIDWFATGEDLCRAHVALAERSRTDAGEPVREILAANPGVRLEALEDGETVPDYVGFKGGSSVGTMGGSWYVEEADGSARVVVVQTAAHGPEGAVHPETMGGIAADAIRLSAQG